MKKFIEASKRVRTWWQWQGQPKSFWQFRVKIYLGYNPRTGV